MYVRIKGLKVNDPKIQPNNLQVKASTANERKQKKEEDKQYGIVQSNFASLNVNYSADFDIQKSKMYQR